MKRKDYNLVYLILILILLFNFGFLKSIGYIKSIWIDDISNYSEDVPNLVDNYYRQTYAFAHGQLYFVDDASELAKLENPYDVQQRLDIFYLFDTSYYDGKYYSYYTAIPIVFILLPLYFLTGKFLNLVIVNLIILTFAILVLSKLYKLIIENYINNIPKWSYILGFITIILGSNMFLLLRGLKYDVAVSCGILFMSLSIYFLFSIYNKKKINLKLFLAGISVAFIVCSKPTYIMYYPFIFVIIYNILKKYINPKKNILFFIVPVGIIAIFQMLYNYARYDSIFEFGARYQLTGFEIEEYIKFSIERILRGMKYYLFQLPMIDFSKFPYIFMNLQDDNNIYNEFLYEECFVGLISFPVIIISIFLSVFTKNKEEILEKTRKYLWILLLTYSTLIVINVTFAGVSETYSIESKVLLMFASIIYLLKYISVYSERKITQKAFIILCIFNILIILPISYSGEGLCFLNLIN